MSLISPDHLTYLLDLYDQAYMYQALPLPIKRIDATAVASKVDDLFDEVLDKIWISPASSIINAIVLNKVTPEIQDRFATRYPIKLVVRVSELELIRQNWVLSPIDVVTWPNELGVLTDYYAITCQDDGLFIDSDGNKSPLTHTMICTDEKAPTQNG